MQASIEYMLAGLTVISILVVAEMNVLTLMNHTLTEVHQEVELSEAEDVLDTLLLSPGYPPNWGESSDNPDSMGLAVQNSIEEYVLDPKKVIRLSEESDYYISPPTTRRLLGLSKKYHFSLRITPFFNITINNLGDGNYTISITTYKGFPAPNVNVTGYYVTLPFQYNATYQTRSAKTGIGGTCTLNFDYVPNSTLIVYADQSGIKSITAEESELYLKVKDGYVIESETPIIQTIVHSTGELSELKKDVVTKFVKIDGYTYYVEFILWS